MVASFLIGMPFQSGVLQVQWIYVGLVLVAFRIWRMTKDIEKVLGKKAGMHYRSIIAMMYVVTSETRRARS
ncbi:hypothetical protein EWM64_g5997 [Hericium alpestre]|uniref:Uncharacterized protein n=1 Tax=Hericium alpestre TaxID=135208 RepID=A0A4Y9ZUV3_9AGAM|nr:hypothetical protein EWM64_g5997 [Hericium alpestre]